MTRFKSLVEASLRCSDAALWTSLTEGVDEAVEVEAVAAAVSSRFEEVEEVLDG